jgi:NADH:ubiquinone oxidoreductase subunit E
MLVGEEYHGSLTTEKLDEVLKAYEGAGNEKS